MALWKACITCWSGYNGSARPGDYIFIWPLDLQYCFFFSRSASLSWTY